MHAVLKRLLNASIATKFIGLSATLLLIVVTGGSLGLMLLQKKAAVHEANLFADGIEKVALSGLTTLMMTGQMQHRAILLDQINESGIVSDLRIIRGPKVVSVFGEGRVHEKISTEIERKVLESGEAYFNEGTNSALRIVKPIRAKSNYLGKNCLGCHQASENEILGAITMKISLSEIEKESRTLSFNIFAVGMLLVFFLIAALLLLSRFIIHNPLEKLLELFQRLQNKDYTQKIVPQYRDEVGRLSEGVTAFLQHSIELLTKLSKIGGQLSFLAGKNREASETFVQLAQNQSLVIATTSAAVQEMNASLKLEKEELTEFMARVVRVSEYADAWGATYKHSTQSETEFVAELETNGRKLRKAYKILLETSADLNNLLEEEISDREKKSALGVHAALVRLKEVRLYLHDGILGYLRSKELIEKAHENLQSSGIKIQDNEMDIRKIEEIHGQIIAQFATQTETSGEISEALSRLAGEATSVSASAAELAQVSHEASRLAVLLKDLLHEFKLP